MRGLTWRFSTIAFTIVFAVYLLIPSYLRFKHGVQIPKTPKAEDPWYYHVLPSETLKLGLDLMGGLHLVLGIDYDEVNKDAVTKLKNQLKDWCERDKCSPNVSFETTADNKILVKYQTDDEWKQVDKVIGREMSAFLDFDSQANSTAKLRMSQQEEANTKQRAREQSIETLRNRIDEFGIAEPIIQPQGDDKILVQFPGVQETGRLKEIISRTAKLSFQVEVAGPEEPGGPPAASQLDTWVADFTKAKSLKLDNEHTIASYAKDLNEFAKDKIPAGTEILFHKRVNVNTKEAEYIPYLLRREALVTGEDLQDARYGFDPQSNTPIVNFELTPIGAQKFEKATGENVHKYMAIVLDSNVHSAPRIKQKIGGGRAMIEMGATGKAQQDVLNDANDTALVLRSGALPARLEFLEERVVGPSLGGDAIRAGTLSLAAGLGLVFLFMAFYYRASGLVADLALGLNGLFIVAALAAFEGTLTLPGLAGITLTLGMAVDANVLIFEHLREELRMGKSLVLGIAEGYSRAFSAIIDTHMTSIISAIILLEFGYGPIRGFAVTLLIGLAASLFTAVFVTRAIFDYYVIARGNKTISV